MTKVRKKIGTIPINDIEQQAQQSVNTAVEQMQQDVTDFINEETAQYPEIGGTFKYIEDPEDRSEVVTDSNGKILSYRDSNGVMHEKVGIETDNAIINHLNLTGTGMTEFQQALKNSGFKPESQGDWSENVSLEIPMPRCAIVNITNDSNDAVWPTSKTANYHYYLQFWDMQGNYFKKPVIYNAQGNSSMGMPKKNAGFDIFADTWDGESFTLKIGNWVPQDSFHLKAYYADYFVGVCPIGYKLFDQIQAIRDVFTNRDWKKALLPSKETIGTNCNAFKGEDDKYSLDNDARCYPDGFPCITYLNGEFYGVYSWQLKKHRDNYQMSKKKPKHIHLDGAVSKNAVFLANGIINWDLVSGREGEDGVEFRNPKPKKKKDGWGLLCIDGTTYDGDNNMNELMGEDTRKAKSIYVWSVPSEFSGCTITITIDGTDFTVNVPSDATRQSVAQQIASVDFSSKGYTCYVVNSARVLFVDENENPQWHDLAVSVAGQTRVSVTAYNNYSIDYDANNESHVKSNQVKQIFIALSTRIAELREMENPTEQGATPATESEIRAKIAEYFDIQSFIDYLIFGDITANYDGFIKNWQWITYDGKKWFVEPYDLDGIFGWSGWGPVGTIGRYGNSKDIPTGWIIQYYQVELNARYKELRDKGILSTSNIIKLFKEWIAAIGTDNFQRNHDKWPIDREHYYASPVDGHFDNIYRVSNWLDQRIANCDTYYSYEE